MHVWCYTPKSNTRAQAQYNLYQECVFLYLISGRTRHPDYAHEGMGVCHQGHLTYLPTHPLRDARY
eukprot:2291630-Rhodomonas_salina.1